jgi:hypothetical protein
VITGRFFYAILQSTIQEWYVNLISEIFWFTNYKCPRNIESEIDIALAPTTRGFADESPVEHGIGI